jgi:predicted amidohydrolase
MKKRSIRSLLGLLLVVGVFWWLSTAKALADALGSGAQVLRVSLIQFGIEPTLDENRDKIVLLTKTAAAAGARVTVFPEAALASPRGTAQSAINAALRAVANAAKDNRVYVVTGVQLVPEGSTQPHQQLYVFGPEGQTLLVYDKVWHAKQFDAPKLAIIDGVPCGFILCADRWSKPVESLPAIMGAQILFECSNNFDTEWLPSLEWYWYTPRAVRNTAYVIFSNAARENRFEDSVRGHGHSAIIAPDGSLLASAGDERDKIITADLDLSKATRDMAIRRSQHPLFKEWWKMGQAIHQGKDIPALDVPSLVSSESSIKAGFGLMPCTSSMENNVETLCKLIGQAADSKLDLVVFPELAVTGNRSDDIRNATAPSLTAAVESIRRAASDNKITVVFGSPSFVHGKRRNSAYVIGPDGTVLTRYDQIVVGRSDLFDGGLSTKSMWFQVNGLWSVVTIGEDALWNEIAELAALRGARLHCHLRHDRNLSASEALFHEQLIANLASHRTLTIVANPLHPDLRRGPDARFSVGAGIWDDLEAGDWCAVKTVSGRPWQGVFSAPRISPGPVNPTRQRGDWPSTVPRFRSWMLAGISVMDSEIEMAPPETQ